MNRLSRLLPVALCLFLSVTSMSGQDNSSYILTPKAPDTPRIGGAKIYGERPGADFLFKIAATGIRPMTFSAEGLPAGLELDRNTGIITGTVREAGEYTVTLTARNALGADSRSLKIVIGNDIVLTPPMGWNSWNVWGNTVSQEKVISSARALLDKGLDQYGWTYINIDDGWQGIRGGRYNAIQPNSKFPDMKGLGEWLHANGLKFGIYSGPWITTYASHIGSSCDNEDGTYPWIKEGKANEYYRLEENPHSLYQHGKYSFARQDARQWADWGVDYLKYDWDPNDYYELKLMHDALRETGRDIVYSISNSAPITLAAPLMEMAQCWRTTGDIDDSWFKLYRNGFTGLDNWAGLKRPGHWPDGDMLVVGKVGWGPETHPTNLTPDEQYTHFSLWALMACPLLLGCDLAELDDFTLSLLCNHEVIEVNQDPLGIQCIKVYADPYCTIYMKPMEDGSLAFGMFNLSEEVQKIGLAHRFLKIQGEQTVRDLWRQEDVGVLSPNGRWETEVAPHGVALVKLSPGWKCGTLVGYTR